MKAITQPYWFIIIFKVTVISRAQAAQRSGRAGRTAPGKCYRLYMLEDYDRMMNVPTPSIHQVDLASTVLRLKGISIDITI
jgi:HrpA-like RNA helicase